MLGSVDSRDSAAAALVALVRAARRPPSHYADQLAEGRSAADLLKEEHGLLAPGLANAAAVEIDSWQSQGLALVTVLDRDYPENLRAVHDRPPFIFVRGELRPGDARAVAVIGSRRASPTGIARAHAISGELSAHGYTIISGLALGIDTAAHLTALEAGARTLAIIGTGLNHCYPVQNCALQRRIASECAVVSQFWPDDGPRRESFPQRNALMSGLSLATVIVEAGHRSGARTQARHALRHGRPVLLERSLLDQDWAQQLAARPGAHVVSSPSEVVDVVERVSSTEAPAG